MTSVPTEFLKLAWLPESEKGSDLSAMARTVLFQVLAGAWTGLVGLDREEAFVRPRTLVRGNLLTF